MPVYSGLPESGPVNTTLAIKSPSLLTSLKGASVFKTIMFCFTDRIDGNLTKQLKVEFGSLFACLFNYPVDFISILRNPVP